MLPGQGSDPTPDFVVNTITDDATGTEANCTSSPEGICTLRDALAAANAVSASDITFDPTVFLASNSAAANTITLANSTLNIPTGATITGLTSGSGATLTNLVTVSGNNTSVFSVASGVTGAVIANLNIINGYSANGGGIYNAGALTVTGSTFNGNSAYPGDGGGIFNSVGGTLTVTDCTFFGNGAWYFDTGSGGAIYSDGTATVMNSSFTFNSSGDAGGGISSDGMLTVTNSTFFANLGVYVGGGIFTSGGTLTVTRSTFAGNYTGCSPTGYSPPRSPCFDTGGAIYTAVIDASLQYVTDSILTQDSYGECGGNIGDFCGGANIDDPSGTQANLAPLGNYGGPTQTMLPQPGSAAICGGIAAYIPEGVTTDQRGYPIENTTYPGYSSSTPCVDSGAVQTNYSLAFTTQPPAKAYFGLAIIPAPVVALTESGNLAGAATGTVRMTDSFNVLLGTTSEGFSSGTATFGNLVLASPATDDIFTATLGLNPSLNIAARASVGVTASAAPATMLSPTPGIATILGTSNVTFTWTPVAPVTLYDLWVGTKGAGSDNAYVAGHTTATSVTVPKVPYGLATDTVYVRLWCLINGIWQSIDYVYSETPSVAPVLTIPTPGLRTVLGTSNVNFTWTPGTGPTLYDFWLGTKGVGSDNVYVSGSITATSATAPKVPYGLSTDTLYVRLWYLIDDTWQYTDYTYSATPSVAPVLTTPTPGTVLGTSNVTFTWTPGTGPTLYDFWLSTAGVGTHDLYVSGRTTATSTIAPRIGAHGATIYARLWYLIDDTWQSTDYTYTEP